MPMTGRLSNKHADSSQSVASRADRFKNPEYRSDNWLIGSLYTSRDTSTLAGVAELADAGDSFIWVLRRKRRK